MISDSSVTNDRGMIVMKKRIIFGFVLLMLFISGCAATGRVVQEDKIKIGVFAVMSGEAAVYGEAIKKGLDLAADDINSQGGVLGKQIELVYEDTHLDRKLAVTTVNKFISIDRLPIIISGEGSGATLAAAPVAEQSKTVLMAAIASSPDIKYSGDYVFRVVPSDDYQGSAMARLARNLSAGSAAVLYVNDAFGLGITGVFKDDFGNILVQESFESGITDVRTQLTKIKAANPDVLVIIARAEYPYILQQAQELGLKAKTKIITSAELKEPAFLKAAGSSAEGVFVPFYAESQDYVGFNEKFKARYGSDPALFSDYGYDAMKAVALAIEKAGSTNPAKVKDALYKTSFKGTTGMVKFDSNGEAVGKAFDIFQVRNGEFVKYG